MYGEKAPEKGNRSSAKRGFGKNRPNRIQNQETTRPEPDQIGWWEVTVEPLKFGQFEITATVEDAARNIGPAELLEGYTRDHLDPGSQGGVVLREARPSCGEVLQGLDGNAVGARPLLAQFPRPFESIAGDHDPHTTVEDEDPSHYYGLTSSIDIEKATNGQDADTAPGPYVPVGDTIEWIYLVQNAGNAPLDNVVVTDDQGVTPVFANGDDNSNSLLDPGEIWVYKATGTASAGQYTNLGSVTGTDAAGTTVGDGLNGSSTNGIGIPTCP